jgi:hypothetical protein
LDLSDLLENGYILERITLEIHDEITPDPTECPPDGPPETIDLDRPQATITRGKHETTPRSTWGLSPHGPVVE